MFRKKDPADQEIEIAGDNVLSGWNAAGENVETEFQVPETPKMQSKDSLGNLLALAHSFVSTINEFPKRQ
jgi:hypothetical protein